MRIQIRKISFRIRNTAQIPPLPQTSTGWRRWSAGRGCPPRPRRKRPGTPQTPTSGWRSRCSSPEPSRRSWQAVSFMGISTLLLLQVALLFIRNLFNYRQPWKIYFYSTKFLYGSFRIRILQKCSDPFGPGSGKHKDCATFICWWPSYFFFGVERLPFLLPPATTTALSSRFLLNKAF